MFLLFFEGESAEVGGKAAGEKLTGKVKRVGEAVEKEEVQVCSRMRTAGGGTLAGMGKREEGKGQRQREKRRKKEGMKDGKDPEGFEFCRSCPEGRRPLFFLVGGEAAHSREGGRKGRGRRRRGAAVSGQ